ncbi:hypothetical protein HJG60_008654 [Phyllostomus discolor]|uniref:Uncharacterized protein n=1 Tax=Phyllostomus discolor TaxID=89673 RepID=A0A833Z1R8_9CHIR|nr:hypothetical protein HJG60_008654 [Phyllostomus discolor]
MHFAKVTHKYLEVHEYWCLLCLLSPSICAWHAHVQLYLCLACLPEVYSLTFRSLKSRCVGRVGSFCGLRKKLFHLLPQLLAIASNPCCSLVPRLIPLLSASVVHGLSLCLQLLRAFYGLLEAELLFTFTQHIA